MKLTNTGEKEQIIRFSTCTFEKGGQKEIAQNHRLSLSIEEELGKKEL